MELLFVAYIVSLIDSVALQEQVMFCVCPMECHFIDCFKFASSYDKFSEGEKQVLIFPFTDEEHKTGG